MKKAVSAFAVSFLLAIASTGSVLGQSPPDVLVTDTGQVISVLDGVLYIEGIPSKVALVSAAGGETRVTIPMSAVSVIMPGEEISYRGVVEVIAGLSMVNTVAGYAYRAAELDPATYTMQMMDAAYDEAAANAALGIPDAVPVTTVLTPDQTKEVQAERVAAGGQRATDLMLTILSVIVALLAFDRVPALLAWPIRFVRRLRRRPAVGDPTAGAMTTGSSSG